MYNKRVQLIKLILNILTVSTALGLMIFSGRDGSDRARFICVGVFAHVPTLLYLVYTIRLPSHRYRTIKYLVVGLVLLLVEIPIVAYLYIFVARSVVLFLVHIVISASLEAVTLLKKTQHQLQPRMYGSYDTARCVKSCVVGGKKISYSGELVTIIERMEGDGLYKIRKLNGDEYVVDSRNFSENKRGLA